MGVQADTWPACRGSSQHSTAPAFETSRNTSLGIILNRSFRLRLYEELRSATNLVPRNETVIRLVTRNETIIHLVPRNETVGAVPPRLHRLLARGCECVCVRQRERARERERESECVSEEKSESECVCERHRERPGGTLTTKRFAPCRPTSSASSQERV